MQYEMQSIESIADRCINLILLDFIGFTDALVYIEFDWHVIDKAMLYQCYIIGNHVDNRQLNKSSHNKIFLTFFLDLIIAQ